MSSRAPMASSVRRRASRGPWWLSPTITTLLIVPGAALPILLLSDETFRVQWRTPKVITDDVVLLFVAGGIVLALCAYLVIAVAPPDVASGRWPNLSQAQTATLSRASTVCFWLTVAGYIALAGAAARSGITLSEVQDTVKSGDLQSGTVESQLELVPGITSLTQVGVASVIISTFLASRREGRRQLVRIGVLLSLALPRAYLLTERLALLELAVPIVVVSAMRLSTSTPRGHRMARWTPAVAVPAVLAVFAAFEYSRSWVFYRAHRGGSFVEFALQRIAGYYVTALNNGYIDLMYTRFPGYWPAGTFQALWTAPGIAQLDLLNKLNGINVNAPKIDVLVQHGNPEFNNPGGIATPFVDYGWSGGLVYLAVAGVVVGLLYRNFQRSTPEGLLLYPVVFLGLVEIPRYLYWSQGRALPAGLALGITAYMMRRAARRENAPKRSARGARAHPVAVP